jgi:lipopolysaccharide transport system permease protein
LWLVIKPIVDTFGKALVFGGVFGATAPEGVPYLLFVIVGMQCWIVFEQTVTWATRSYDRYRKIFRDIDIPLLLIPISVIADPLLQFLSYTGIFLVMLLAYYFIDGQVYLLLEPQLLLAPVALALTMVFALGLGIWLGIGNAQTRDVRWGVRYVLQIWMFLTPVLYPLRDLPGIFPTLAQLNPMTPLVEMFKFAVLGTGYVDARTLAYSVGVAVITLLSGVWVLSRLTPWLQLRAHRTLGGEDELTGEDEDDAVSATEERRPPR